MMRYRTIYRICLLVVIILTLAGGIFYYVNYVEQQDTVTEGTLVKGLQDEGRRGGEGGSNGGGYRLSENRAECAGT